MERQKTLALVAGAELDTLRSQMCGKRDLILRRRWQNLDLGKVHVVGWRLTRTLSVERLQAGEGLYSQGFSCCVPVIGYWLVDERVHRVALEHVFDSPRVTAAGFDYGFPGIRRNGQSLRSGVVVLGNGRHHLTEPSDPRSDMILEKVVRTLEEYFPYGEKFECRVVDLGWRREQCYGNGPEHQLDVMVHGLEGGVGVSVWRSREPKWFYQARLGDGGEWEELGAGLPEGVESCPWNQNG